MLTVFISMPYGDHNDEATRLANTQAAMDVWHALADGGFAPFCPHLSHFLNERRPRPREDWLRQCAEWMRVCDCLLAIGEPTEGMRQEIDLARRLGKLVFTSTEQLNETLGGRVKSKA